MKFRRIIASILAAAVLTAFTACSGNSSETSISSNNEVTSDAAAETAVHEPTDAEMLNIIKTGLPSADYEGYDFVIVDRTADNAWMTRDIFTESLDGDPINDAVYERNSMISEMYNVTIKEYPVADGPVNTISKSVLAGDDSYDALTDGLSQLAKTLATKGYLVDLRTVPYLELSKEWWDQSMVVGLSIADKLYFATGDISIMDNYGTWCVLFNKSMRDNYNLENPYELVENNKWTLAKMYEMAKSATVDIDGDGVLGEWDQYGFLSESFNTYGLWLGSGERITTKNADDLPELTVYNERSERVLSLVLDLQLDIESTITGDRHKGGMVDGINVLFGMGQGLFLFGGMWLISEYRDSEVDFGILPSPKYEESQEKYCNTYSYSNCTANSVPVTASNLERTGMVLEAMAALSKFTLTPAYYETTLVGKFLRDDESKGMIDLVLANRSYDLCALFDWGGMFSLFGNMYSAKAYDFSSRYAQIEDKTLKEIDDFIAQISG